MRVGANYMGKGRQDKDIDQAEQNIKERAGILDISTRYPSQPEVKV